MTNKRWGVYPYRVAPHCFSFVRARSENVMKMQLAFAFFLSFFFFCTLKKTFLVYQNESTFPVCIESLVGGGFIVRPEFHVQASGSG